MNRWKRNNRGLTSKQQKFVDEYMKDNNAARAAERMGARYDDGGQYMKRPSVRREIRRRMEEISKRTMVSAQNVVERLWAIADADLGEFFDENNQLKPIASMSPAQRKLLASVDVNALYDGMGRDRAQVGETKSIKLWNKVHALELLAKKFKLLTDKVQLSVDDDVWKMLDDVRERKDRAKKER